MDWGLWKVAADVIQFAITSAVGIYVWAVNRNRVTNERISTLQSDMDDRLDDHADRLARVEEQVRHAPDDADIARVHARIDEVSGALKRLEGESAAQTHVLRLIHEHLMRKVQ